jgi:hypothetical protein
VRAVRARAPVSLGRHVRPPPPGGAPVRARHLCAGFACVPPVSSRAPPGGGVGTPAKPAHRAHRAHRRARGASESIWCDMTQTGFKMRCCDNARCQRRLLLRARHLMGQLATNTEASEYYALLCYIRDLAYVRNANTRPWVTKDLMFLMATYHPEYMMDMSSDSEETD